ncbi:MAG: DUF3644 domain-containing protein [Alphaproteobacteria bacterium]
MLHNIKPKRTKSRGGSLTSEEKPLIKGLLAQEYIPQDIVHIINQGRKSTINPARIAEVKKNDHIQPASDEEIEHFFKVQSSYDPKTLLNPYKDERLIRAREAMLSAVQVFNSPTILFKTEAFAILAHIAWTYLLHEKMERIKIRSSVQKDGKSISLSAALKKEPCPIINKAVLENLKVLIRIRNEVEHTFFRNTDECFGTVFQSCCLNFEKHMTNWFGQSLSLSQELSLSLQFTKLDKKQITDLENTDLPEKIRAINHDIQNNQFANDDAFQLTVFFSTEVTSKTAADVHKLVNYDPDKNTETTAIKKIPLSKYSEKQIVEWAQQQGYTKFTKHAHQTFWKTKWKNASERDKKAIQFGELFNGGWGW